MAEERYGRRTGNRGSHVVERRRGLEYESVSPAGILYILMSGAQRWTLKLTTHRRH